MRTAETSVVFAVTSDYNAIYQARTSLMHVFVRRLSLVVSQYYVYVGSYSWMAKQTELRGFGSSCGGAVSYHTLTQIYTFPGVKLCCWLFQGLLPHMFLPPVYIYCDLWTLFIEGLALTSTDQPCWATYSRPVAMLSILGRLFLMWRLPCSCLFPVSHPKDCGGNEMCISWQRLSGWLPISTGLKDIDICQTSTQTFLVAHVRML